MDDDKKVTVGAYIAARLSEIGLKHYFAVPGDYNLALLDELLKNLSMERIREGQGRGGAGSNILRRRTLSAQRNSRSLRRRSPRSHYFGRPEHEFRGRKPGPSSYLRRGALRLPERHLLTCDGRVGRPEAPRRRTVSYRQDHRKMSLRKKAGLYRSPLQSRRANGSGPAKKNVLQEDQKPRRNLNRSRGKDGRASLRRGEACPRSRKQA
mgnify:CR=1 FL=1